MFNKNCFESIPILAFNLISFSMHKNLNVLNRNRKNTFPKCKAPKCSLLPLVKHNLRWKSKYLLAKGVYLYISINKDGFFLRYMCELVHQGHTVFSAWKSYKLFSMGCRRIYWDTSSNERMILFCMGRKIRNDILWKKLYELFIKSEYGLG